MGHPMANPKRRLKLEVFSGFHDPDLDPKFLAAFLTLWENMTSQNAPELDIALYGTGDDCQPSIVHPSGINHAGNPVSPSIFLGFSAGCLRAAFRANDHHRKQMPVIGLIALDGWGIPLMNRQIPSYRWSHDTFTHISSAILGGQGRFFADPPVPHLFLWDRPELVRGWYSPNPEMAMEMNAAQGLVLTIESLAAAFFAKSETGLIKLRG